MRRGEGGREQRGDGSIGHSPRLCGAVVVALLFLVSLTCHAGQNSPPANPSQRLMAAADFQALPVQAPDRRLAYGDDPNQFGELRLPKTAGLHPLVVLVHGGCWKASYSTLRDLGPMGDALKAEGIASWNIEYRRLPQSGSGWPGTYLDVAHALDYLRSIAPTYALDLERIVVVGHSAGGHLAMWAATRPQIAKDSALFLANPLPVRGVMNLAGTIDMADNIAQMDAACGDSAVSALLGGAPDAVPERYREVSANNRLPLGIPQVMVWGALENFVPQSVVEKYVRSAQQAGDDVRLLVVPGAGHFEIASPRSTAWSQVRSAIRSLLGGGAGAGADAGRRDSSRGPTANVGQRDSSKAPARMIDGTTIVGDSDQVLWKAVLDLLPVRPRRVVVLDLDAQSEPVRAKLRGLDAFVLAGQTTIAVIRQGATLRQAAFGDEVDRLVLASVVWHEMAHAQGSDERAAFAAEETLWRRFILTGRVPHQVGMAYVARLRETSAEARRRNEPHAVDRLASARGQLR